ncbi:MAG: 16S rRNA (guanine(527)-N(7))-methyltransferase RsmG [Christensenellaceae bacterium]|nr:16S rRNA (guanine(527)-N(7))-methyltransferase RsmG [Christensenellaceae bacterium]
MSELKRILLEHNIPEDKADLFEKYAEMIVETNKSFNLTRILSEEDMAIKHFIDSIAAMDYIPEGAKVIDVGTGAGFPIVPLAIMRSDIRATAVESSEKKLGFVKSVSDRLGLNIECVCARAEELAQQAEYREQFDHCVSRAVAALPVLLELGLPFVKVGGSMLAYKGALAAEEAAAAENGAKILGADKVILHNAEIDGTAHCITQYKKIKHTHVKYPRRYAQIKKSPL